TADDPGRASVEWAAARDQNFSPLTRPRNCPGAQIGAIETLMAQSPGEMALLLERLRPGGRGAVAELSTSVKLKRRAMRRGSQKGRRIDSDFPDPCGFVLTSGYGPLRGPSGRGASRGSLSSRLEGT